MEEAARKCASCGGNNLHKGSLAASQAGISRFIPKGAWFWVWTFPPKFSYYACLDCGFVNQYFDEKQLDKLRQRVVKE